VARTVLMETADEVLSGDARGSERREMSKRDEHRARKQQSKGKHAIIGFEVSAMNWFWTWGGKCFGYRVDHRLFAYFRLQVGRFDGDEVYAADGCYLGEIMNENRPTDSSIPFLR
jgi:hypothetical protein